MFDHFHPAFPDLQHSQPNHARALIRPDGHLAWAAGVSGAASGADDADGNGGLDAAREASGAATVLRRWLPGS